ncbi:glucose-1-phosphate cytidylyltransferase [Rhizomicrobium palustre]|uniref:Glucose-1-phosphate cytidylyltransferase n=2 Tax=Rhizomicrobium palustre TaxID=189966 RepID=A0A846MTS8_9PROT|nr:glucose-1-phosphate cytidylyltransferase [Rhizomicrobium palustre]NIK86908.1 glucose-1-phosphate cytidylyltransferase [Rhizomicrobium palustre]
MMKAVILAGGLGSRLSEETESKPKPMVEVGGRPILWHIMKIYSYYGINDFVVCLGYKGAKIKEYFFHYRMQFSDLTFDMARDEIVVHSSKAEPWRVTLVETGEGSMTGGRLRRVREYVKDEEAFCFTYGDGVSDVPVDKLVAFHKSHGKLATVTAVRPLARFGALVYGADGVVHRFEEKPVTEGGYINGGFFVLSPKVIDYIADDLTVWERDPMEKLVSERQMAAFEHGGFWQAMDTLRDKQHLESLWASGEAPWRVWGEKSR